ncbi:MAG: GNAT family N-acetyltransferase [Burkholderiales bacterium]
MIEHQRDAWLSEVTGMACHRHAGGGSDDAAIQALAEAGDGFHFAKLGPSDVAALRAYQRAGFYLVDTNVVFAAAAPAQAVPVGGPSALATPADHDSACELAGRAFSFSRFHLDPLFPDALADRIKAEWVRSYCKGRRGDALFVTRAGGRVTGFLAAMLTQAGTAKAALIDLIAVDAASRRSGAARTLIGAFRAHYAGRVAELRVGTQLANPASIALYQACGFGLAEASYTLHAHRRDGVCL